MILTINDVDPDLPNAKSTLHPWTIGEKDVTFYLYSKNKQASLEVIKAILKEQPKASILLKASIYSDVFYQLIIDDAGLHALKTGEAVYQGKVYGETLSDLIVMSIFDEQPPITREDVINALNQGPFPKRYYYIDNDTILSKPMELYMQDYIENEITTCLEEKHAKMNDMKLHRHRLVRCARTLPAPEWAPSRN
jgi:hypothetical protein